MKTIDDADYPTKTILFVHEGEGLNDGRWAWWDDTSDKPTTAHNSGATFVTLGGNAAWRKFDPALPVKRQWPPEFLCLKVAEVNNLKKELGLPPDAE